MKATFFLLLSVLFLSSCQVPTSVSTASTNLIGSDLKISLPPLIVGLDGPTWETHEAAVDSKGWSHPIDDTYTRVKTSRKVIAITFDDGPHPENTPRLLDMLKERKIKATFYVVGDMVKYSPQLLRRMVAEGHEIGTPTASHG
ncbi:MAG TPA: polysaccharide deacetylase family protein, partial [Verrucomicrobiales bacterium]|nr:polysaccharide deacetylase family protein [Verrucomicrobiales bacterium]